MEPFLTTLPPYVHQYINKYPPTDCFNVLKELICFAVLYTNDRERTNLLSLDLLHKKADQAVIHRPYSSSSLTLSSMASTLSIPSVTSREHSTHHLVTPDSKTMPSKAHSVNSHECNSILEEELLCSGTSTPILDDKPASPPHKSATMPYTFPDWWAHPDTEENCTANSTGKPSLRSISPSNERQRQTKTPERSMTTTQEMNITNWIPVDYNEHSKPNRNQTTERPISVHNPVIPDLRSYLGPNKKPTKDTVVVRSTSVCESPTVTHRSISRSSSTSTSSYRPGQTATVRARAEQAKQRQLQLEEDKRKTTAKSTSRTSLRLKQSVTSGIDWDAIKQDRRKTLPVQPS